MKILVTGAAGFIGNSLSLALLESGHSVVGIDNFNSYYDPALKYDRLARLGLSREAVCREKRLVSHTYPAFTFQTADLIDSEVIIDLFEQESPDIVINLAGQAGVRYSIENPHAYIESNILGFLNILEGCRRHPVRHLLYASSSSVYGMSEKTPYAENDRTDSPVSLYAATKKSNELMAYAYSRLYQIPATGLRFFTVYGPWGRPDMAPSLFMRNIMEGKPIRVFNHGHLSRDFTYIDDIIDGVLRLLYSPSTEIVPHRVYNIGHSSPTRLMDFIQTIERYVGRKAILQMEEMQAGDVLTTYADVTRLKEEFGYAPRVDLDEGIRRFHEWFKAYYFPKE